MIKQTISHGSYPGMGSLLHLLHWFIYPQCTYCMERKYLF